MNIRRLTSANKAGRIGIFAFGLAMFVSVCTTSAFAGCGSFDPAGRLMFSQSLSQAPEELETQSSDQHSSESRSIVGLWKISFNATDGSGYTDFGYTQWHSDGTEFLNSGSRAPSTQNYCLGVWEQTGSRTYSLNHFALSYDAATGALNGKVRIQETVTLGPNGNQFEGTFIVEAFDPTGTTLEAKIQGNVTAKRVTVHTKMP